jgi:hypothetical protein
MSAPAPPFHLDCRKTGSVRPGAVIPASKGGEHDTDLTTARVGQFAAENKSIDVKGSRCDTAGVSGVGDLR